MFFPSRQASTLMTAQIKLYIIIRNASSIPASSMVFGIRLPLVGETLTLSSARGQLSTLDSLTTATRHQLSGTSLVPFSAELLGLGIRMYNYIQQTRTLSREHAKGYSAVGTMGESPNEVPGCEAKFLAVMSTNAGKGRHFHSPCPAS